MFPLCLSSTPSFLIYLPPQNYFQTRTLTPSPLSCSLPRNQSLNYTRTLTYSPIHSFSSESSASPPLLIEDITERDWSFLDVDAVNSEDERRRKIHRNISAAAIREGSRVLVCMGSEWFVDQLVESVPSCELLLIIHESLFALAMIKEKYDNVRCWQGDITALPERFSRFDAVFVCYFPGMGVPLDQLLSSVGSRCSPGCRLLICFDQGRDVIEGSHRRLYPDRVTSELPEKSALEKAAAGHSFQILEFVDEPTFYLAVLTFTAQ
ncbi:hypothetical protein KFK09_005640 [Dendrobium nobile]|uniref:Uncharacterized protein n=1 Tax=Dendrobium nobile TaxID=94219 RepID=A0A8T3C1V5_DENNO|nr:hypothetical protein KFK09_005640 [Dendrobium nobile]